MSAYFSGLTAFVEHVRKMGLDRGFQRWLGCAPAVESPLSSRAVLLFVLSFGPGYGRELAARIRSRSHGRIEIADNSLYSALRTLESEGLVQRYEDEEGHPGRARLYYGLTDSGHAAAGTTRETVLRFFKLTS